MIDDTDWFLLEQRLQSIERSIEMLRAMFPEVPVVECSGDYILEKGSLTDSGTNQVWRNKDDE